MHELMTAAQLFQNSLNSCFASGRNRYFYAVCPFLCVSLLRPDVCIDQHGRCLVFIKSVTSEVPEAGEQCLGLLALQILKFLM